MKDMHNVVDQYSPAATQPDSQWQLRLRSINNAVDDHHVLASSCATMPLVVVCRYTAMV